ncbi:uncharacterized protein UV8b_07133 [Ustilaginoidea virens]|uniref:Uncharacterized protein n=1 Tax=Ustilaginoidea virens TaxID=1159556 RepID=A0A8E5MK88_USTVR|nr:uncharacterized protein UV8b_07133 [Ustilaginoidea virens]QUC22892.1 hypothetical protein UV8b_07133 [Ustilaginoidea virens]
MFPMLRLHPDFDARARKVLLVSFVGAQQTEFPTQNDLLSLVSNREKRPKSRGETVDRQSVSDLQRQSSRSNRPNLCSWLAATQGQGLALPPHEHFELKVVIRLRIPSASFLVKSKSAPAAGSHPTWPRARPTA